MDGLEALRSVLSLREVMSLIDGAMGGPGHLRSAAGLVPGARARIPLEEMQRSIETYTLPELEIVQPKMAICPGAATFNGFRAALGYTAQPLSRARFTSRKSPSSAEPRSMASHVVVRADFLAARRRSPPLGATYEQRVAFYRELFRQRRI